MHGSLVSRAGGTLIGLLGATLLSTCAPQAAGDAVERPNIVLIVIDTARADHFSHASWRNDTTPNISVLCADAVTYTHAHSVAPWTLPSHMSMFTGLLPGQHGATWASFDDPSMTSMVEILSKPFRVTEPERMLARRLKDLGYTTVGISANPWISARTGFDEGFDALYDAWRIRPGSGAAGKAGTGLLLYEEHRKSHGLVEPFFLFFNFIDLHFPYQPVPELAHSFGGDPLVYRELMQGSLADEELEIIAGARKVDFQALVPYYDATLLYTDFVIGVILERLRAEGLYDRSLVIVTSDHGEHLGEGGRFSHQLSVEEELLRVPLVVKYPGGAGAGTVVDDPLVSTLDLYATILAAAGGGSVRPHDGSLSLDLARMDRFDREWLLAEYYASRPYLSLLRELNPAFDMAEHYAVRRALYTKGRKYVFRDAKLIDIQDLAADTPSPSEAEVSRVCRQVEAWDTAMDGRAGLRVQDAEPDPALIETLRAMGYVGD